MRICLTVHGFPPFERTGVEGYTRSLAEALARAGHGVEVFAPRPAPELPHLATRREERDGWAVTWIATNVPATSPEEALDPPGVAARFGDFLDQERPDVCHFQHLVKLGTSLVDEARSRGIPTVLTAHDYWAVCHRYTLLRPDLERCATLGRPEVCALCDLALGHLNGIEGLGDYQMGVLDEQLASGDREVLAALLAGEHERAGISEEELAAAVARRERLDRDRLRAVRSIDRVLAPTRFLAERLEEGGVDPDAIVRMPYGIDTAGLAATARDAPVGHDGSRPLRIGFFGGFSKHKGALVLLEAFRRLDVPAECILHGYGTDEPYVALVERAASEAGARLAGSYEREELPALLVGVDVVVVPSVWVENQPIVIREAFAAGRPVVASRVGAMEESVRDGVDGLLFEPGDPDDLARALTRLATEEGVLERLARGIEPVHDVDAQARELEELYRSLAAERASRRGELPASLAPHVRRYDELAALPTRELFARAAAGVQRVSRELLGGDPGGNDLLVRALERGSRVQDLVRDRGREADWVRQTLDAKGRTVRALDEKLEWIQDVARDREERLAHLSRSLEDTGRARAVQAEELEWLRGLLSERDEATRAMQAERDHHAEARKAIEEERDWLAERVRALEEERDWLSEKVGGLEPERDWLRETVGGLESERDELRGRLASHERDLEELGAAIRGTTAALREAREELPEGSGHEGGMPQRVRGELQSVLDDVEEQLDPERAATPGDRVLGESARELVSDLAELERELGWRREEMQWFGEVAQRLPVRVSLALARARDRIRAWRGEGPA